MRHDARVVDQDVDPAEPFHHGVQRALHGVLVADVERDRHRFRDGAEFLRGCFGRLLVQIGDNQFCAAFGQGLRGMLADPLSPAGDDGDLSLQHRPSSR